jgi:hypothetical protein
VTAAIAQVWRGYTSKGGLARAAKLSPGRRRESAAIAAPRRPSISSTSRSKPTITSRRRGDVIEIDPKALGDAFRETFPVTKRKKHKKEEKP